MPKRAKMDLIRAEVGSAREELLIRDFHPERSVVIEFQRQRVRYTREKTPAQIAAMADYQRARQAFASDQEMAELLNVHRTRLAAWKQGLEVPNPENAQLLSHLAVVISTLVEFLDEDVTGDWLLSPQLSLGGSTPLQALREGHLADVLQAANATEHGAYS
jgi:DNA-binding transcriptional regulator YiaG